MLDLKEQSGVSLRILQIAHGKPGLGRPVPGVCKLDRLTGAVHDMRLCLGDTQLLKAVAAPADLPLPAIVRHIEAHLPVRVLQPFLFQAEIRKTAQIFQCLYVLARICDRVGKAGDTAAGKQLNARLHAYLCGFILLRDDDHSSEIIFFFTAARKDHGSSRRGRHIHIALLLIWPVKSGKIDLGKLIALLKIKFFVWIPEIAFLCFIVRQGRTVQQADLI